MAKKYTAKAFQPDLLLVLGQLSDFTAGRAVPMKDVIDAVLGRMGLAEDALGRKHNKLETHRLIQLAFRSAKTRASPIASSPAKGQWALNKRGVAHARQLAAAQGVQTVASSQETPSLQPPDPSPTGHVYESDPYLRQVAIAMTPCFGRLYDAENKTCDSCILAKYCQEELWNRCAQAMEQLDTVSLEEGLSASEGADGSASALSFQSDEQVKGPDDQAEHPYLDPPQDIKLSPSQLARAFRIRAETTLACQRCSGYVHTGDWCYFVRPIGAFHKECFQALRALPNKEQRNDDANQPERSPR